MVFKNIQSLVNSIENEEIVSRDKGTIRKNIYTYEVNRVKTNEYAGNKIKKILTRCTFVGNILALKRTRAILNYREKDYIEQLQKEAIEDVVANKESYIEAYNLLDEESQNVYMSLLLGRITGDFSYMEAVLSRNEQYFSDKIKWHDKDEGWSVVDCGAYVGDTLARFLDRGVKLNDYYLYELDDDNYLRMMHQCDTAQKYGFRIYSKKSGVYNETKRLYYLPHNDSSMIVDYDTGYSVPVVALDDDVETKVDYIKMDIEGSEIEALNGARELIKTSKPILAICIYHKQQDFWKVPLLIKEICPDYTKFWIEQYAVIDTETVLYASV